MNDHLLSSVWFFSLPSTLFKQCGRSWKERVRKRGSLEWCMYGRWGGERTGSAGWSMGEKRSKPAFPTRSVSLRPLSIRVCALSALDFLFAPLLLVYRLFLCLVWLIHPEFTLYSRYSSPASNLRKELRAATQTKRGREPSSLSYPSLDIHTD